MTDSLSRVFSALADPTRRDLVARLAAGDATVGQLAAPYRVTVQAVSKHVKVLEDAGLIARRKQGRTHVISLEARPLEEAERWMRQWEKFWNVSLDRLEALIERDKNKENNDD